MSPPDFAIFRYTNPNRDGPGSAPLLLLGLFVLSMPVSFVLQSFLPVLGCFLLLLVLLVLRPRSRLCLAPRYLVCSQQIIYYRNVTKLELNAQQGILQIYSTRGQPMVLERAHFPTNARKPHKIAANQQAKFDKVTQKIVRHVRSVRPNVTLSGIDPGQA